VTGAVYSLSQRTIQIRRGFVIQNNTQCCSVMPEQALLCPQPPSSGPRSAYHNVLGRVQCTIGTFRLLYSAPPRITAPASIIRGGRLVCIRARRRWGLRAEPTERRAHILRIRQSILRLQPFVNETICHPYLPSRTARPVRFVATSPLTKSPSLSIRCAKRRYTDDISMHQNGLMLH
jgi:hypothetical protein